jgi:membrane protein implicated in regulation of membrane protease activity
VKTPDGGTGTWWPDFRRYLLWQVPGWVVAALVVIWLAAALSVPAWLAIVAVLAWIAKDVALFPAVRQVFRPARPAAPVGERGVCVEALEPRGYVRVRGELWRAESRNAGRRIAAGRAVVVREACGLTLIVEEDESLP